MLPHYIFIGLLGSYAVALKRQPSFEISIAQNYHILAFSIIFLLLAIRLFLYISRNKNRSRWKNHSQIKNEKFFYWILYLIISQFIIISIFYFHARLLEKDITKNFYYGEKIDHYFSKNLNSNSNKKNASLTFTGTITKDNKHNGKYFLYEMSLQKITVDYSYSIENNNRSQTHFYLSQKHPANIRLQSFKKPQIHIGDVVEVSTKRATTTRQLMINNYQRFIDEKIILNSSVVAGKLRGFSGFLLEKNIVGIVSSNGNSFKVIGQNDKLLLSLYRWHRESIEKKALLLNSLAKSLSLSLISGEKNYLPKEIRNNFIRTGTYHTLAISGMHVGLLLISLVFLLRMLKVNFHLALAIAIFTIPFALVFLPFQVPVLRAYFMAVLGFLLYTFNKRISLQNIAAVCFITFLFFSPYSIYSVGFQFSFAAVFSIAFALSFFKHIKLNHKILKTLLISSAIFIATTPTSLAVFSKTYPAGIFYNLFIPPLILLVLLYSILFYLSPLEFLTLHFAKALNFLAPLPILLTEYSRVDNFLPQTLGINSAYALANFLLPIIFLFGIAWAITVNKKMI